MWQEDQTIDRSAVTKFPIYTTIAATQAIHQVRKTMSRVTGGLFQICSFRNHPKQTQCIL